MTTQDVALPFKIGEVKWMPAHAPRKIQVECPVCAGQLAVTVILGGGESVSVPCECCGKGWEGPRGVIEEWEYDPQAVRFEIASIASMHNGRWWVGSTDGAHAEYTDLRETEDEALAVSAERCAKQYEHNMATRARNKRDTKEHTWSIQYHRKEIAHCEQRIAWHRSKIEARKAEKRAA
jgi:hypothetical protein